MIEYKFITTKFDLNLDVTLIQWTEMNQNLNDSGQYY